MILEAPINDDINERVDRDSHFDSLYFHPSAADLFRSQESTPREPSSLADFHRIAHDFTERNELNEMCVSHLEVNHFWKSSVVQFYECVESVW